MDIRGPGRHVPGVGGEGTGDVHQAASQGEVAVLVELVQQDPSLLELQDADGMTPLAQAVSCQQLGAVKRLVKLGANVHAQDHFGRTCLCIAAYQGWYQGAVYLLRHGARQNLCDKAGRSPLQATTYNTDTRTMALMLQNLSVTDVNHIDNEHMTALHWAAFHQRPDHLHLLLEHGADANARDIDGKTALHWASQNGCARSVVLLLGRWGIGSRMACDAVNAVDHSGKTPAHFAAAAGHHTVLGQLAAVPGCNLEARDPDDRMPLHWAAAMGQAQCVAALLRLHVSPNARDTHGGTPLEYANQAASPGRADCKKMLQAAMNMTGEEETTPRTSRSRRGPLDFFRDLLMPKRKSSFNNGDKSPSPAHTGDSPQGPGLADYLGVPTNPPPTPNHLTKVTPFAESSKVRDSDHDGFSGVGMETPGDGPGVTTRSERPISLPVVASLGKDSLSPSHSLTSPNGEAGEGTGVGQAERDQTLATSAGSKKSRSKAKEKKSGDSLPSIHSVRGEVPLSPSALRGDDAVPTLNLPPDSRLRTPRLKELKPVRGTKAFAGKNDLLVHGRVAALQVERDGANRSPTPPGFADPRPRCRSPAGPSPLTETRADVEKRSRGRSKDSKVKSDVVFLELSSFSSDCDMSPVAITDTFPARLHAYPDPTSSPFTGSKPSSTRSRGGPTSVLPVQVNCVDDGLDTTVSTPVFPGSEDSDDGIFSPVPERHQPPPPSPSPPPASWPLVTWWAGTTSLARTGAFRRRRGRGKANLAGGSPNRRPLQGT